MKGSFLSWGRTPPPSPPTPYLTHLCSISRSGCSGRSRRQTTTPSGRSFHMHTHARTHPCTHTRTYPRTHTHTHTRAHTRTHTRTHPRTHTHTHARTHAHTHARARTHARRAFILKLRTECGYQFTSKLEHMFTDMKVSRGTQSHSQLACMCDSCHCFFSLSQGLGEHDAPLPRRAPRRRDGVGIVRDLGQRAHDRLLAD